MKPFSVQIKNDTKRLLRGKTCESCKKAWRNKSEDIICRCKGRYVPVPLVHTCYKYEGANSFLGHTLYLLSEIRKDC